LENILIQDLEGINLDFLQILILKINLHHWRFHFTSQNIFNQETAGIDPDSIYFFEQATNYFVLDQSGNQIIEEDGSFKMIEYDGYLDRSRLGSGVFAEGSLYSKRFFSDFQRVLLKNKKENLNTLAVNLSIYS